MGKRKGDKEDPALVGRKKGYGKGLSNIIHIYRDERKVVTQVEIHSQPESHSQEPQPVIFPRTLIRGSSTLT